MRGAQSVIALSSKAQARYPELQGNPQQPCRKRKFDEITGMRLDKAVTISNKKRRLHHHLLLPPNCVLNEVFGTLDEDNYSERLYFKDNQEQKQHEAAGQNVVNVVEDAELPLDHVRADGGLPLPHFQESVSCPSVQNLNLTRGPQVTMNIARGLDLFVLGREGRAEC